MDADELQKVWQSQDCGRQIAVDAEVVLKLVQRSHRTLQYLIFWRDVREVGIAAMLAAFFVFVGVSAHFWPCCATAGFCLFVGLFMLGDRLRMKWKTPTPGETIVAWTDSSLAEVKHQIWLLTNVLWWYLLPLWLGCVVLIGFVGSMAWGSPFAGWGWRTGAYPMIFMVTFTALCYGVYRLNQYVVRTELQPRKEELQTLLESLKGSG
jgi:hypothetical protein